MNNTSTAFHNQW